MLDKLSHYKSADEVTDSRELIPDIDKELHRTIVDKIRGDEPSTALGVLMDRGKVTMEAVTGLVGSNCEQVQWVLEELMEADLALSIAENGLTKYIAWAPAAQTSPQSELSA